MSAERFARYAYAIVKFDKGTVDQTLYDTKILSSNLAKPDNQGQIAGLPQGAHWQAIGNAFLRQEANGISLKFERDDPALVWEQRQAIDLEADRISRKHGRTLKSSEIETFFRIDVISSPSANDAVKALSVLVDMFNKLGAPVENAYVASEATSPTSVGTLTQTGSESHFMSAKKGGMGIRYFQKRVPRSEGQGVSFADVEHGWILDHRDLRRPPDSALIGGSNIYDSDVYPDAVNPDPERQFDHSLHGLGMLGLILAKPNGVDVKGIAPFARPLLAAVSQYDSVTKSHVGQTKTAINAAVANLNEGDVLLIEIDLEAEVVVAGMPAQYAHVPLEAHPHLRKAIDSATDKGIIVIEPAGNTTPAGILIDNATLPASPLSNLNPALVVRSEAIVVGAGSNGPENDYQRTWASNYGDFVDCFADGDYVWVLNSEPLRNEFPWLPTRVVPGGGTSAAAALIAGVVLILQSYAKSQRKIFSPTAMRTILRNPAYGTQSRFSNDRIGTMPDMKKIYNDLQNVLALSDPYP